MSNFNTRIKLKRDTAVNWTVNNPVLLNGEIILIDTDSGELRAKVGDGTKTYTQLPFTDEILRNLITNKQDKNNAVSVEKGAQMIISESIGSGPFTIEIDEDEDGELSAVQVKYDNSTSGMTSTNIQDAVTELFTSVSEGKSLIAAAVTDSGIQTAADATFTTMAENAGNIVGQFSNELDLIIGDDTTPIPDAIAWADKINGEDISGGNSQNSTTYNVSYIKGGTNMNFPEIDTFNAGDYVVSNITNVTSPACIKTKNEKIICYTTPLTEAMVPEKVFEIINNRVSTRAGDVGAFVEYYHYFVMPSEDVIVEMP